jgi:copper chaperone
MNKLTLTVTGMSCMGCVKSVERLVSSLPGVASVDVDLASGRVEVAHDPAMCSLQMIRQSIEEGGYKVAD